MESDVLVGGDSAEQCATPVGCFADVCEDEPLLSQRLMCCASGQWGAIDPLLQIGSGRLV